MKKLLIVFLLITVACKTETKEQATNTENKVASETTKELEVVINFKTNKTDEFKLMLNNIEVDEFQRKHSQVIEKVTTSTGTDEIVAKFGANNISKNFHIDFGAKEIKQIEIESIKMSYGKNELVVTGSEIDEFFTINKYIEYDKTNNVLQTKRVEGNHYPIIVLKPKGVNILKKE